MIRIRILPSQPRQPSITIATALETLDSNSPLQPLSGPNVGIPNGRPAEFENGEIANVEIRPLRKFSDERGWLTEIFREDDLDDTLRPAMAYLSETLPNVVRGPHEHTQQTDYFAFVGPGDFDVYLWDARPTSRTQGKMCVVRCGQIHPSVVIIPPGVVHAYKNVSDQPGWVFNLPNQLYAGRNRQQPVDEIRHENDPQSPYQVP